MDECSSFETPFLYSNKDYYIRAVRLNMIRKNGEIKDCVFKSKKGGVSVTRSNDDLYNCAMKYMETHFEGIMLAFQERVCVEVDIFEKHSPTPGHNLHHWELYGSKSEIELSDSQINAIIDEIYSCDKNNELYDHKNIIKPIRC